MDATDRAILAEFTADARLPFRELGRRVGLSPNAAAARVRRMLAEGVLLGFTVRRGRPAEEAAARTPGLEAFIDVRLRPEATFEEFTAAVSRISEVIDAAHVTGPYDHLLHVVVPDAAALDALVRRLKSDAGAAQTSTRLALRTPAP